LLVVYPQFTPFGYGQLGRLFTLYGLIVRKCPSCACFLQAARSEGGFMTQREREKRFEEMYERYWPRVFRYALRRTGNRADAQDAVIETFAICWRRLDQVKDPPLPWLYGVARRVMANQRRQEARRESLLLRAAAGTASGVADSPLHDGKSDELLYALSRLKEEDREVLLLVAWEDLTHEEAAQVLGCSRSAFTKRFLKARSRLKALMQ
jgi:RNA polymerase sigma factor (sigma-70 family)